MQNFENEKYLSMNPFLDFDVRFNKMIQNYKKFGSLVIGVDFDFTMCCPISGKIYSDIIKLLQKMQYSEINFILCVWTANENPNHVKQIWEDHFLEFSHYNYSPINPGCIKPHFNILLDDSAGLYEAKTLVERIIEELQPKEVQVLNTISNKFESISETSPAKKCDVCLHFEKNRCLKNRYCSTSYSGFVKCDKFESNSFIKTIKEMLNEK